MANYVKADNTWMEVTAYYMKTNNAWSQITASDFINAVSGTVVTFGGGEVHSLTIGGAETMSGENANYIAIYDRRTDATSAATWSIVTGSQYAEISATTGELTILTAANASTVVIQADYNGLTATKTVTLSYKAGASASTETEIVIDESGNTTTTTTTVIDNGDGTSTVEETTVITDDSGNTVGTQESTQNNNADGSYESTSTTYDQNGNPTETTNASGDTDGNVNTQGIEYNESGDPVVTAYTIDTSENPDGEKNYNGDGVNTEYYAFDMTHGFVLHMHFTLNFTQQPTGQDENHHNILTMKRATPSPWYGFQIRQTGNNKYIQLGTQFTTGSNTNTTIPSGTTASANTAEYDLTITYNPTASTNSFVCRNNLTSTNVYTSNNKFPDIDDLKYLKVTIGYAMDANGDPFRYSNINVLDFSLTRT
jgi:hypothetical protein